MLGGGLLLLIFKISLEYLFFVTVLTILRKLKVIISNKIFLPFAGKCSVFKNNYKEEIVSDK